MYNIKIYDLDYSRSGIVGLSFFSSAPPMPPFLFLLAFLIFPTCGSVHSAMSGIFIRTITSVYTSSFYSDTNY